MERLEKARKEAPKGEAVIMLGKGRCVQLKQGGNQQPGSDELHGEA